MVEDEFLELDISKKVEEFSGEAEKSKKTGFEDFMRGFEISPLYMHDIYKTI